MKLNEFSKRAVSIFLIVLTAFLIPKTASAQIRCTPAGGDPDTGIGTAIGCIPFENANSLTGFLLRFGVGIGGGIAFLLMVYAGFLIITSAGDPKRLNAGKELLVASLSGLLLLVFSVFLLRLLGQDILNLPGFGQ